MATTDTSNYFYEYGGVARANHVFFRNKFDINDGELVKQVCANIDVYQSIYAYENENIDSCKLYGPLYFDLDGDMSSDEGYDSVRNDLFKLIDALKKDLHLAEKDIDIYFSGNKGFHVIILPEVLDIEPDTNLNLLYKRWAIYMHDEIGISTIDLAIYDRRRLLRVEGSINGKSRMYKVSVSVDDVHQFSRRQLQMYASNPLTTFCYIKPVHQLNEAAAKAFSSMTFTEEEKKQIEVVKERKDVPMYNHRNILPCVKNILDNDWPVSKRNNALYNAALSLKQNGWSYDEVVDTMLVWNANLTTPLTKKEVIDPINSIFRGNKQAKCWVMQKEGYCVADCPIKKRMLKN